jgi:tetrapyrrole methylase family protein/MazG family protein
MEDFEEIIAHLRAPYGCPWDREQTHLSLRKHLLEEAYEAIEALDAQDVHGMVEEFGDLLLQIVLHAEIATESGEFRMADVIQGIYDKIIRRHPHVFGDVQVEGVGGVLVNWEKLKAAERESNGEENGKKSLLDGVPTIFPALAQAHEIQDRAARVGFDWMDVQGVIEKVKEEIEEVEAASDMDSKTAEIGDLLFALVNLARWEKVDAEAALRAANARFRRRFGFIEAEARQRGITVNELSVDEMNHLWDEAKGKKI